MTVSRVLLPAGRWALVSAAQALRSKPSPVVLRRQISRRASRAFTVRRSKWLARSAAWCQKAQRCAKRRMFVARFDVALLRLGVACKKELTL